MVFRMIKQWWNELTFIGKLKQRLSAVGMIWSPAKEPYCSTCHAERITASIRDGSNQADFCSCYLQHEHTPQQAGLILMLEMIEDSHLPTAEALALKAERLDAVHLALESAAQKTGMLVAGQRERLDQVRAELAFVRNAQITRREVEISRTSFFS